MLDSSPSRRDEPRPRTAAPGAPVILVGADGGPGGGSALAAAGRLAARLGAEVVVGHAQALPPAVPVGEAAADLRDDLEVAVLLQAAASLDPFGVPWRLALADGEAGPALRRLAEQCDADLVVVGSRGCGVGVTLRRLVGGSVSAHLVHHETRPVLVVPPPGRAGGGAGTATPGAAA
ncbi:MAG TPA: universal stress protein [Frankiaceae bacterium]